MKILKYILSIRIVYSIVFLSLISWAYFAYYTMSEQIKSQEIYAKIINLSGKQRMLSQKTALISNRIYQTPNKELKSHLKILIDEMKNDHDFIINNLNSQSIKDIYFNEPYNLNKKVNIYIQLLQKYYINNSKIVLEKILNESYTLLPKLNYAVYEFEKESNEATNSLLKREQYIFIGTLLTLLIESIFIVIPIIRKNEEKEKELIKINSSLEKKVQEELRNIQKKDEIIFRQSKMSSMGEMLQNISHQWRQPLSVITTAASGMKLKKDLNDLQNEEIDTYIDQIMMNSNYLSQTIDDFRSFFSKDREKNKFYISAVINKSLKINNTKIEHENINVILEFHKDDEILGYENEILQVFLNILGNSIDALRTLNLDNKIIKINTHKNDNNFIIEFIDNGNGINDEIKDRIFEAYFTTKHKSQRTGIGLYMSYEIITKHFDGTITHNNCEVSHLNNQYQGSKFTISLPLKTKA